MRTDELARMRALDKTHWWFLGRRYLLRSLLPVLGRPDSLVLDAGCGTGLAASELSPLGTVVGLDICAEAFELGDWPSLGLPCVGSISGIPFRDSVFDLIAALDVLEHLDDDAAAIREFYRVCKPGGSLLVTVPAYRWLWSSHDEALGHRRRYSASVLSARLRAAQFEIRKLSYAVSGVLPPIVAIRLGRRLARRSVGGSDMAPVPSVLNSALAALMRAEAAFVRRLGLPFGLTVLAVATRPQGYVTASAGPSEGV